MQEKKDVKEIIIKEALRLFNINGFVNVRLQHIADAASISVGHMAYHYKNKEAILLVIYASLNEKQRTHLTEFRVVPLFEDIERQIASTFQLQQEYIFFYQDMLEIIRGYPQIKNKHHQQIDWQIKQIQMMIDFNIARGVFNLPVFADLAALTAKNYWAASEFWCYQQSVAGLPINDFRQFRESVWSVLKPMFTHVGQLEFNQLTPTTLSH